jgi:hypothetical protein
MSASANCVPIVKYEKKTRFSEIIINISKMGMLIVNFFKFLKKGFLKIIH